jgi:hypothetical protein
MRRRELVEGDDGRVVGRDVEPDHEGGAVGELTGVDAARRLAVAGRRLAVVTAAPRQRRRTETAHGRRGPAAAWTPLTGD